MAIFNSAAPNGKAHDQHANRRSDQLTLSIVAAGMTITGNLETEGVVKVEGCVKGTVRATQQVLVAKGGVVEGDLHTAEAIIGGEVRGITHAEERVEIQATASVEGDILTRRIVIMEGGRVNGEVKMGEVYAQVSEGRFVANEAPAI